MKQRWLAVLVAVFFILVVTTGTWGLHRIELQSRRGVRVLLNGVLRTTHNSVREWSSREKSEAQFWARFPEVVEEIQDALRGDPRGIKRLQRTLSPEVFQGHYLTYLVLNANGATIASSSGDSERSSGLERIGALPSELRRLKASPVLGLPFKRDNQLEMAVTAPVIDSTGRTIAILAFLLDPRREFTSAIRNAWVGGQAIAYAFDRSGQMISESQFDDELSKLGLIDPGTNSTLGLKLRDPGSDLTTGGKPTQTREKWPLTDLVKSAITGTTGMDLDGYRDYRGRRVIGAWEWIQDLGFGIAIEVDAAEIFIPFKAARGAIFLMLGIVFGASLLLVSYLGRQTASLYRAVGTLRKTEETLRSGIELRNEFISIAAHEINTPLTPIRMELDLLGRLIRTGDLATFPRERLARLNGISLRETDRIRELVLNYLDVTKIESGHFPLAPAQFDLVELTEEVCYRFWDEAGITGSTIQVVAGEPVLGVWDRHRIEQVLINLLNNAIKFGRGNPVQVKVESVNADAEIQVTDYGDGISEEDQKRIFQRFEKAELTRNFRGMGLGLYIVNRIVEDHGGKIRIDSRIGTGATFTVTLPKKIQVSPLGKVA